MALAPYSEQYWYPDSSLAVGVSASVFPRFSTTLAPLFADQAGTIPLPNPLVTSGSGFLTFFAESGDYWVHIHSQTLDIVVTPDQVPAWPSTSTWEQTTPAAIWTVTHDLGVRPSVTVLDTTDRVVTADVAYVDEDTLTVAFGAPTAGVAYLRR